MRSHIFWSGETWFAWQWTLVYLRIVFTEDELGSVGLLAGVRVLLSCGLVGLARFQSLSVTICDCLYFIYTAMRVPTSTNNHHYHCLYSWLLSSMPRRNPTKFVELNVQYGPLVLLTSNPFASRGMG